MALARKKQDEKNLKTLRELVSLAHNRHCFDCNQRGPTYVNVTIGSFVCTKCSGLLRGLTPPHRVKSMSMATFTPEEIEFIRSRGNDYCQRVWLGLYEGPKPSDREEITVNALLDKYERKRYYMDPSVALRNGYNKQQSEPKAVELAVRPMTSIMPEPRPLRIINGDHNKMNNGVTKDEFVADFAHADIFNATNNNNSTQNGTTNSTQPSFANFDNNPIFNNETQQRNEEEFSIFNLQFTNNGPVYNQVPLFPKINYNRWNTNSTVSNGVMQQNHHVKTAVANGPPAPPEDRYAALKDLDNALKSQSALDWNSGGSNSSLYSSPTAAGSLYSSTASPQSSSYGSPSQGQFMNLFASQEPSSYISNPFNTNGMWNNSNGNQHTNGVNPFRSSPDTFGVNGGSTYPSVFSSPINGTAWTPNPFKVANGHSSNPFL